MKVKSIKLKLHDIDVFRVRGKANDTLGGVHQAPLYGRPRELPPLKPVVADSEGDYMLGISHHSKLQLAPHPLLFRL
ncbi:hypothetical protein F2Q70_00039422 [Brassica cretica]|uniref:Uncharacterized protein n=1 Tax=Brassica cretica TaxID=69181 RepID=A0A8S9RNH5_BRACR|nr:hypothetical protein F2Q70_00039422 [Brassica cretica]KAF3574463.1 hypothetical protein F2Q69_00059907 [Brassica cretica]